MNGLASAKIVQSENMAADPLAAVELELSTPEGIAASMQRIEMQNMVAIETERLNQLQMAFRAKMQAEAAPTSN